MEIMIWVGGILAMIGAVWFGGRKSGKEAEKYKREAEVIEAKRHVEEVVTEAKRKADAETIDTVRSRLKSGSVRRSKD